MTGIEINYDIPLGVRKYSRGRWAGGTLNGHHNLWSDSRYSVQTRWVWTYGECIPVTMERRQWMLYTWAHVWQEDYLPAYLVNEKMYS